MSELKLAINSGSDANGLEFLAMATNILPLEALNKIVTELLTPNELEYLMNMSEEDYAKEQSNLLKYNELLKNESRLD